MSDDHNGNAGSAGPGQQQGADEASGAISESSREEHLESQNRGVDDEQSPQVAEIESLIGQLSQSQFEQLLEAEFVINAAQTNAWSGLLPAPDDFLKYPESVQKSMVEWNNAQILDESRRADDITKAVIRSTTRSQWLSFAINTVFTVSALVSFVITRDPASFGFLALPGVNVVFNIWKSRKKDDSDE